MKGQIARGGATGGGQVGQTVASEIAKGQAGDTAPGSPTMEMTTTPIPTIKSQEEYDALPSGSQYYDSAGKPATKK
jgi:hypothetical protein